MAKHAERRCVHRWMDREKRRASLLACRTRRSRHPVMIHTHVSIPRERRTSVMPLRRTSKPSAASSWCNSVPLRPGLTRSKVGGWTDVGVNVLSPSACKLFESY